MSIISRMRKQYAVYWAPEGLDKFGRRSYVAPIEIRCRWEDINEQVLDPTSGEQITTRATVYVDRYVDLAGVLWKGRLANISQNDILKPFDNPGAWEIRRFDKLPNLKATEELLTAYL